jgi:glycosyltransferase involved in cell wall biosynthesis
MPKPKVAWAVPFVPPYRICLFSYLASKLDVYILEGRLEADRTSWKEVSVPGVSSRQVAGWQFPIERRRDGKEFDRRYLHIEPGYFFELLRLRPDAVVSAEMGFRTLMALLYSTLFSKAMWVFWGGTPHTEQHIGGLRRIFRRLLASRVRNWISYGQTSTEYLLSLGIRREQIVQAQNSVDETWYRERAIPALDLSPKPVLLHVGRMIALKGIAEFLQAAAKLQEEGLEFSILLVGDGPERNKLRRLSDTLQLRHVHFYPPQPAEAMPRIYASADVLVFATMQDVWGLVANEAMLTGMPVLCSKYAGCAPELFDPEATFDPADRKQFIAALRRAIAGQLPRSYAGRLRPTAEIADELAEAIIKSCSAGPPKCPIEKSCIHNLTSEGSD